MYMGFMRMGVSLMLGFMILVAIVGITNLTALSVFPIALYAYSFFHANHLATLEDGMFHRVRDEYLFGMGALEGMRIKLEGRNRKVAAVILIVLGVMMLWQVIFSILCDIFGWDNVLLRAVYYFVQDELPRAVLGIGVIWAGLAMIRGRRITIEDKDAAADMGTEQREQQAAGYWTEDRREQQAAGDWTDRREQQAAGGWTGQGGRQCPPDDRMGYAGDRPVYGEKPVMGGQPTGRDNMTAGGQMTAREIQPVADGRIIYGEGPVADGRIIYGEGPVADGRIVYGEGPTAGERNMPENRK